MCLREMANSPKVWSQGNISDNQNALSPDPSCVTSNTHLSLQTQRKHTPWFLQPDMTLYTSPSGSSIKSSLVYGPLPYPGWRKRGQMVTKVTLSCYWERAAPSTILRSMPAPWLFSESWSPLITSPWALANSSVNGANSYPVGKIKWNNTCTKPTAWQGPTT